MSRAVTIYDVAKAAGVSSCCVSWVLRDHPRSKGMNIKTRQRILDAASKLGYVQNLLAAATRTGQVCTIAVILNFMKLQSFDSCNRIFAGIMQESTIRRHSVKIFDENELELSFRLIAENRIGKVISLSVENDIRERTAELAEKYSIDLVFCYEHGHGKFPSVNTDNAEMTDKAVHYLTEHGHSRIGLLCVPHRAYYVTERYDGYLRGMTECGLEPDPRWVCCSGEIEKSVDSILALPEKLRPTAFVAQADTIAVLAQRRAWERGLRIPEDFSVIGIGDSECSSCTMIPITTFREVLFENGRILMRLLFGEKPDFPPDEFNVYRTHAEMIERKSVFNIKNSRRLK